MAKIDSGTGILVAGIGLLLAQGVIHLIEAPAMYAEVPYLGVLFVLTLVGALVAPVGMVRGAGWGWLLGVATAGGPLLGYVLSRSIGIPGLRETDVASILEPLGVACVIAEVLFVVLAARVLVSAAGQPPRWSAEAPAR